MPAADWELYEELRFHHPVFNVAVAGPASDREKVVGLATANKPLAYMAGAMVGAFSLLGLSHGISSESATATDTLPGTFITAEAVEDAPQSKFDLSFTIAHSETADGSAIKPDTDENDPSIELNLFTAGTGAIMAGYLSGLLFEISAIKTLERSPEVRVFYHPRHIFSRR